VVGTLDWARRTGGRLSARDKAELVVQAVRRQASELLPRRFRLRDAAAASLDVGGYQPPDTASAREAEELCREASGACLEEHCHRTHLWGVVLGRHERLEWDEEGFYVACLLHDLGLTERYAGHDPNAGCFTLDSASGARDVVGGWPPERADAVAEAITLHTNALVPLDHGVEAYLLQLGAAVDVTGMRFGEVERATRDAIVAHHPRHEMKAEFVSLMKDQAERNPDSRAAFFTKRLGFARLIARAPFPE
jgi:hypothetical protein